MSSDIAIKVEHLTKLYDLQDQKDGESTVTALDDVSFEIKKGESVGIIGPNGSGKSTLLKILAQVSPPSSGRIEINGRLASILEIGAGFHPELSGRENIFLNGEFLGFKRKQIHEKYDEIVAFSGIEAFINEPVKNYSNGMYLRLAFSIMAHLDFDIYLFDEVMSVGDAEFQQKAFEKVKKLLDSDKTILLVSHNMNEVLNLNWFLLLENGKLKSISSHKKLLDEYIENQIKKTSTLEVFTQNIVLKDFEQSHKSDDIEVKEIQFYQDDINSESKFETKKKFTLSVEYEKLSNEDTIDVILNVLDLENNIVLTSTGFVNGDYSSSTQKGRYIQTCDIDANLFNPQVYRLGIIFLKNCKYLIEENLNNNLIEKMYQDKSVEFSLRMDNVISFRPIYIKGGKEVDFSSLNLRGQLLAGFDWKLEKLN